jgi:catechol 2,3-dioxygenase-like lactoylglutathione lyase family enzyme
MPDKPAAGRKATPTPASAPAAPAPGAVRGLGAVVLIARDFARQVAFYRDVLALPLEWQGDDAAIFRCGDQKLAVFAKAHHPQAVMRLGGASHGLSHLQLDIDPAQRAALAARLDAAGCRAYGENFEDADGNLLSLDSLA